MRKPFVHLILLFFIFISSGCEKKTQIDYCIDYIQQGLDFYEAENYNKALLQFKKAENLYPKYYLFPLLTGRCYVMLGNPEMAKISLDKTLGLKRNHYLALWEIAEMGVKEGKIYQSIETIKQLYALFQKIFPSKEARSFKKINESYLEFWLGHKIYNIALSEGNLDFSVSMRIANLYKKLANFSEAELWLEKAKTFSNTKDKMYLYYKDKGVFALLQGNGNDGFSFFKKALEYHSQEDAELNELIDISKHFIFGEVDKIGFEYYLNAISTVQEDKVSQKLFFKKACQVNKNFLHACLRYAKLLASEGEDKEAREVFAKLLNNNFGSLKIRTDYILFLRSRLSFAKALEILNQTFSVSTISKSDLDILNELKIEIEAENNIYQISQEYFQLLYKRDFTKIYNLHSKFLKERKNQFQFANNLKQVYEDRFLSNCTVSNILLNKDRMLAKAKASCFESKDKINNLTKISKEFLFENQAGQWGFISSDIVDVLDDYINAHQGVGGILN